MKESRQTDIYWNRIRRKTGKAIAEYDMIQQGDRLMIGVSGGKDSMVLLKLLSEFAKRSPVKFEVTAVTFNPGFPEFKIERVRKFAKQCEVNFEEVQLNVATILEEKQATERPCILCSRLRRGMLYKQAEKMNCNKLVLAHHLDDIATSLLIGLFRGQGLTTMGPNVPANNAPVRIIRPLAFVCESEIIEAAKTLHIRFSGRCPYSGELKRTGDRAFFEKMLKKLETRIPHVRELMLHSMSDVRPGYLLDKKFLSFGNTN